MLETLFTFILNIFIPLVLINFKANYNLQINFEGVPE